MSLHRSKLSQNFKKQTKQNKNKTKQNKIKTKTKQVPTTTTTWRPRQYGAWGIQFSLVMYQTDVLNTYLVPLTAWISRKYQQADNLISCVLIQQHAIFTVIGKKSVINFTISEE